MTIQAKDVAAKRKYWKDELAILSAGCDVPTTLLLKSKLESSLTFNCQRSVLKIKVPDLIVSCLQSLCKESPSLLHVSVTAALMLCLRIYSGHDLVSVGVPAASHALDQIVNILPISLKLNASDKFKIVLKNLRDKLQTAYLHQGYPYHVMVEESFRSDLTGTPADFGVVISTDGLHGSWPEISRAIAINASFEGAAINLIFEYDTNLYQKLAILAFADHLCSVLTSAMENLNRPISQISILNSDEIRIQKLDWNSRNKVHSLPINVVKAFEYQVSATPDAPCIISENALYTYNTLNKRANKLANFLLRKGVKIDSLVGLYLERSADLVISLFGIIKTGAAYVPLDPALPYERLQIMIEDAEKPIILTQARFLPRLLKLGCEVYALESIDEEIAERLGENNEKNLDISIEPNGLAYMIFTSGSTGRPKGTMNTHEALMNRIDWMQQTMKLDATDRVLQKTPFSFDVSVWEFFWPCLFGAALVIPKPGGHLDSAYLIHLIKVHQVTTLHFVPPMLRAFLDEQSLRALTCIKRVICSGEALTKDLVLRFHEILKTDLFNLYGPTEAAIDVSYYPCKREDRRSQIPIGWPIQNIQLYIVDKDFNLAPIGSKGEICIGGIGLARGYYNKADLTAEKFVPDPFSERPASRLYCTGDLARYEADGAIEYLGRMDNQVKIRGRRIELGEIEAAILVNPLIKDTVVTAREERGQKQIIAYITAHIEEENLSQLLKIELAKVLPEYMIPLQIIVLNEMPLSPNGKIDRCKLPSPQLAIQAVLDQIKKNPIESLISTIWCDLLRLESLDIQTNLFEMGSDSIVAMQAVSRLVKAGIQLTFRDVMEFPTIKEQALIVAQKNQKVNDLPAKRLDEGPLSPMQAWFLSKENKPRNHWNISLTLEVPSHANFGYLNKALQFVFQTHESLNMFFSKSDGTWIQRFTSTREKSLLIKFEDHTEKEKSEAIKLRGHACAQLVKILDIEKGPLAAAIFFKASAGQVSHLFLTIHHLVVDVVSLRIILEDVNSVYEQLQKEVQPSLPIPITSFLSWTSHLCNLYKNNSHPEIEYWQRIKEESKPSWPSKYPHASNTEELAAVETLCFSFQETEALQKMVEVHRSNLAHMLLSAFVRELSQLASSEIVYMDVEGHGRGLLGLAGDLSRTVGWFSSLYPVAFDVSGNPSLETMLLRVKAILEKVPNAGIGFGALLAYGTNEVGQPLKNTSIHSICFNFFGTFDSGSRGGLFNLIRKEASQMVDPAAKRAYDIEILGEIYQGLLYLSIKFGTKRHKRAEIVGLLSKVRLSLINSIKIQSTQEWPITSIQHGMLFQSRMDPQAGLYTMQMACQLLGSFDSLSFKQAWIDVMHAHSILRAAFKEDESGNYTMIIEQGIQLPIIQLDWSCENSTGLDQKLEDFLAEDRRQAFNYFKAPLMRGALIKLCENSHYFIWTHHHAILDGWSVGIILKDLFVRYQAYVIPSINENPLVRGSFFNYLAWLSKKPKELSQAFWQCALEDMISPTSLPFSDGIVEKYLENSIKHEKISLMLESQEQASLNEFVNLGRITLSTLFHGAWALLLKSYSGSSDICFGTVVSTRPIEFVEENPIAGPFINTLPLRVKINENETGIEWLRSLQMQILEMLNHAHCSLVDIRAWSAIPQEMPLFHSIFAFENYPISESILGSLGEIRVENIKWYEGTEFPLSLVVVPGRQTKIELQYRSDYFSASMMRQFLLNYKRLLTSLTAPSKLKEISINDPNEWIWQIKTFNATARYFETETTIHALFQQKAAQTPQSVAILEKDNSYTFADLNSKANQLAVYLRTLGVNTDTVVGICLPRNAEVIISILSILKAGGAYTILEANLPSNRIAAMINQAKIGLVITSVELLAMVPNYVKCLAIDKERELWNLLPSENLTEIAHPLSLAYVLFTSGSTGQPKGVMIHHRALVNYISWCLNAYQFQKGNGAPLISSLSFDLPVTALFGSLIAGQPLHLLPEQDSLDTLVESLSEKTNFSLVKLTPAHLNILSQSLKGIKLENGPQIFVIGGEQLHTKTLTWFQQTMPNTLLINEYGPTETVVGCSTHCVGLNTPATGVVPIGTPIANTQLYILNARMQIVPRGAIGELFIGGAGVCRGYLENPAATAEFFVPDPFSGLSGARLYKTCDLVRFNESNEIVFIGRQDFQVKVRGFRVELGDIESALNTHIHVRAAVVLPIQQLDGSIELVAYVTCFLLNVDEASLRQYLQQCLPLYMIPSAIVILKTFPLTFNGKVDRQALAKISLAKDKYPKDESLTSLERQILSIWAEILGRHKEAIGKHEDFFALGGHSLMLAQVRGRINAEFGVDLSLKTFFLRRTIVEIASEIETIQLENEELLKQLENLSEYEVEKLLLCKDN